jgi:hypothetical protein
MARTICAEHDPEAFRASLENAGFLRPGAPLSTQAITGHLAVFYDTIREPGPLTITSGYASSVVRRFFDLRPTAPPPPRWDKPKPHGGPGARRHAGGIPGLAHRRPDPASEGGPRDHNASTGSSWLDRPLAGPGFLDARAFPEISFRSDLLAWVPSGWRAVGRCKCDTRRTPLALSR